jgi:hypothetical protein
MEFDYLNNKLLALASINLDIRYAYQQEDLAHSSTFVQCKIHLDITADHFP